MNIKDKKSIINRLKSKNKIMKIYHSDIPEEYAEDKEIIDAERKLGMRIVKKIGFDVINQEYFVHENILERGACRYEEEWKRDLRQFENFDTFYDYLDGEIYENACYYQCDFSRINRKVDKAKMMVCNSFIEKTVDDFSIGSSDDELLKYREGEERKKQVKEWTDKFVSCNSFEKFQEAVEEYERSDLNTKSDIDIIFFFWQYIFSDLKDKNHFQIIMQYMSTGHYPEFVLIRPLCHIYNPEDVLKNYNYSLGVKNTCDRHKRNLKNYIKSLGDPNYEEKKETYVFFDVKTHYYCEENYNGVQRFFETFDELIKYRDNDLSNADLSEDIQLNYDFSKCKTNEKTKLPAKSADGLEYVIKKKFADNQFKVLQVWYNKNSVPVKQYLHKFDYFFDFAFFLKGDFSGADLLLCEGLENLKNISNMNFTDAKIRSNVCDKFGIKYDGFSIDQNKIESFAKTEDYEKETVPVLQTTRDIVFPGEESAMVNYRHDVTKELISYISDLHLMHKIKHFNPKSRDDVIYVVQKIVNTIVDETKDILLIGGDVASDFSIFELFIHLLRNELDRRYQNTTVVFVLGNHELWDFSTMTFDKIVNKYKKLISDNKMYLLQNDILSRDSHGKIQIISSEELMSLSMKQVRVRLRDARYILFGGLAFSGYNEEFNANNGIYMQTISRREEIKQSKDFEKLYNKILEMLPDRKLVIFTHTPMNCWCKK